MILNLGYKDGKTYKIDLKGKEHLIIGKRIGDEINGEDLGLPGYVIKLTGGSDTAGTPMRYDVDGTGRKRVLLSGPPGFRPKEKGERRRKSVRGNTYSQEIAQVNAVVIKEGQTPLSELLGEKQEQKQEQ
jgi:small subunit ribosomal protein S6e